jgi:hypothetical protein
MENVGNVALVFQDSNISLNEMRKWKNNWNCVTGILQVDVDCLDATVGSLSFWVILSDKQTLADNAVSL